MNLLLAKLCIFIKNLFAEYIEKYLTKFQIKQSGSFKGQFSYKNCKIQDGESNIFSPTKKEVTFFRNDHLPPYLSPTTNSTNLIQDSFVYFLNFTANLLICEKRSNPKYSLFLLHLITYMTTTNRIRFLFCLIYTDLLVFI